MNKSTAWVSLCTAIKEHAGNIFFVNLLILENIWRYVWGSLGYLIEYGQLIISL